MYRWLNPQRMCERLKYSDDNGLLEVEVRRWQRDVRLVAVETFGGHRPSAHVERGHGL